MQKRLTLTIEQEIYERLQKASGKRNMSRFIEELLRPIVVHPDLEASYSAMAKDKRRETQAAAWAEASMDPLFLKDLDEVAADFGESRHPSAPYPPET